MTDSLAGPGSDEVVGVVLAAGAGTRLRPLTSERPKALCPVGDVPLVDLALGRLSPLVGAVAVNVHHGRAAMEAHLADRPDVHLSLEEPVALGTAGAFGAAHRGVERRLAVDRLCADEPLLRRHPGVRVGAREEERREEDRLPEVRDEVERSPPVAVADGRRSGPRG